jgi:hypothetical protein
LDESGGVGLQNSAAGSFFRGANISQIASEGEKFLYATFQFTGTCGKEREIEFGGEMGELGRAGLNA